MSLQFFELTDEQLITHAWDAHQCQNVAARHSYYQSIGQHRKELNEIWSKRDDISYGENNGFWIGQKSVYNAYVEQFEKGQQADLDIICKTHPEVKNTPANVYSGVLVFHTLMSRLIEVAADGKTAKGMWYSPGIVTEVDCDGEAHPRWRFDRYGIDFIKEDGEWKIWHLFCGMEFKIDFGDQYVPGNGMRPLPGYVPPEANPKVKGMPNSTSFIPQYDYTAKIYDVSSGWCPYPPVPMPYKTFSETFTYGPEPWVAAGKGLY